MKRYKKIALPPNVFAWLMGSHVSLVDADNHDDAFIDGRVKMFTANDTVLARIKKYAAKHNLNVVNIYPDFQGNDRIWL